MLMPMSVQHIENAKQNMALFSCCCNRLKFVEKFIVSYECFEAKVGKKHNVNGLWCISYAISIQCSLDSSI